MTATSSTAGLRDEQRLELRGRHLVGAYLYELLEPVDDEHVAVPVYVTEVAGLEPAVRADGVGGSVGAAKVAGHDLRSSDPELASLTSFEVAPGLGVHHPHFGAGHDPPYRAGHAPQLAIRACRADRGLGHAPALADGRGREAFGDGSLQVRAERRATRDDELHGGQVVGL
jgi:hypothetical protein